MVYDLVHTNFVFVRKTSNLFVQIREGFQHVTLRMACTVHRDNVFMRLQNMNGRAGIHAVIECLSHLAFLPSRILFCGHPLLFFVSVEYICVSKTDPTLSS